MFSSSHRDIIAVSVTADERETEREVQRYRERKRERE